MTTTKYLNSDKSFWVTTYFGGATEGRKYEFNMQRGDVVVVKDMTESELHAWIISGGKTVRKNLPIETLPWEVETYVPSSTARKGQIWRNTIQEVGGRWVDVQIIAVDEDVIIFKMLHRTDNKLFDVSSEFFFNHYYCMEGN